MHRSHHTAVSADTQSMTWPGLLFDMRHALASHEETVRRLLILVALYAIPAVAVMKPIIDPDIWWHLQTGRWIIEHGAVPQTDPFSTYGMGSCGSPIAGSSRS